MITKAIVLLLALSSTLTDYPCVNLLYEEGIYFDLNQMSKMA